MSRFRPRPAAARRALGSLTLAAAALLWAGAARALTPGEMRERTALIANRYLQIWSSNAASPVAAVPYMYGKTVLFYGKPYTQADLQAEKRRAIAQWPVRQILCNVEARKCAARSTIDFAVSNPERGLRKSGSAKFDLGVSFAGPHPVILYEGGSSNRRRAGAGD
jgi:hypothetical protein